MIHENHERHEKTIRKNCVVGFFVLFGDDSFGGLIIGNHLKGVSKNCFSGNRAQIKSMHYNHQKNKILNY